MASASGDGSASEDANLDSFNSVTTATALIQTDEQHVPPGGDVDLFGSGPLDIAPYEHELSKLLWCSWCFRMGSQTLVSATVIGRDTLQCSACDETTAKCSWCSSAVARVVKGSFDFLCAKCDGTVEEWGEIPDLTVDGWCSWCFRMAKHDLFQKNVVKRDVYKCTLCMKRTVPCRSCKGDAYARGFDNYDDEWCAVCDKTIEAWGSADPVEDNPIVHRTGWCSWCGDEQRHMLLQRNLVRRNVYTCMACSNRTLPCMACKTGLARGGRLWDENTCTRCDNPSLTAPEQEWPAAVAKPSSDSVPTDFVPATPTTASVAVAGSPPLRPAVGTGPAMDGGESGEYSYDDDGDESGDDSGGEESP